MVDEITVGNDTNDLFVFLGWFGRAIQDVDTGDEARDKEIGDRLISGFCEILESVAKGELTPNDIALRFTFMMEQE